MLAGPGHQTKETDLDMGTGLLTAEQMQGHHTGCSNSKFTTEHKSAVSLEDVAGACSQGQCELECSGEQCFLRS